MRLQNITGCSLFLEVHEGVVRLQKITGKLPAEYPTPETVRALTERQSFSFKGELPKSPLIAASKLQGIWVR